jgi:outer membrane lipoprotein-sorting protein
MKKINKIVGVFLVVILSGMVSMTAQNPTGKEIVQKAQDKINGLSSQGIMKMTVVRPAWSRDVTMKSWSKGDDYYLILITFPARDKGQVFLKREFDMWNWMPSISRMIKIPPSMMSQSWMGSDFTNDDLVKMNSYVNDYTHKVTGDKTIDGIDCYQIEMIPLPDAAVVWGKVLVWIAKEEYYQLRVEFYNEDMLLVNREICSEIKQMGDRKLPSKMIMEPVNKEGHKTIIEIIEMEFNKPFPEGFFSQQNMKKVR